MKLTSLIAVAATIASGLAGTVEAKSLKKAVPAEFPPASYAGKQYVDSKGCVFIRAGVSGAVTWVPRVTRSRSQICGQRPSLSASAKAKATAPRVVSAQPKAQPRPVIVQPKPVAQTKRVTQPAVRTVAAAPKPTVKPTTYQKPAQVPYVRSTPAAAPRSQQVAPIYGGSGYKVATYQQPKAAAPVQYQAAPNGNGYARGCLNRSATSQRYLSSHKNVRCGPQAQSYTGGYNGGQRVAPKGVYEAQKESVKGVYVPEGYQPVWSDDRLSTTRAHQTLAGKAQMEQLWTKTTPRRSRKTGRGFFQ